jgi:hypothetical protein
MSFYCGLTEASRFNVTVFSTLAACVALGYSNLFLYFAVLANRSDQAETAAGRTISAVGLALLSLTSTYLNWSGDELTGSSHITYFQRVMFAPNLQGSPTLPE